MFFACVVALVQAHSRAINAPSRKERKQAFMKSLESAGSSSEVAIAIQTLEMKEEQHEYYACDGEFLPLSVWTVRGFDAHRIETLSASKDKRVDPILGEVYRVQIMSVGSGGKRTLTNSESLSAKVPRRSLGSGSANSSTAYDSQPLAIENGRASSAESSDSSSSTSSSSSDNKKKSKKHKKSKKDKKHKKSKKDKKHKKDAKNNKVVRTVCN